MLPHRTASPVALGAALLVLAVGVSGCSDSGGLKGPQAKVPGAWTATSYTASLAGSGAPSGEDMRVTAGRLRERAAALGLKGVDVRVDGTRVTIVAPRGVADRVPGMTTTAVLEFRPVLDPAAAQEDSLKKGYESLDCNSRSRPAAAPPDRPTVSCDRSERQKYLLGPTAIPGTEVESASARFDSVGGSGWIVDLAFTSAGGSTFAEVTGTLAQKSTPANQFAIVVDGDVLSAPSIPTAITGGKAQISGTFTKEAAQNLAAAISSGALPVRLTADEGGVRP